MPKQHTTPRTDAEEWVDRINWFVACLEDRIAGNVVRGLSEAEAGYDSALDETVTELARLRGIEEQLEALQRIIDVAAEEMREYGMLTDHAGGHPLLLAASNPALAPVNTASPTLERGDGAVSVTPALAGAEDSSPAKERD